MNRFFHLLAAAFWGQRNDDLGASYCVAHLFNYCGGKMSIPPWFTPEVHFMCDDAGSVEWVIKNRMRLMQIEWEKMRPKFTLGACRPPGVPYTWPSKPTGPDWNIYAGPPLTGHYELVESFAPPHPGPLGRYEIYERRDEPVLTPPGMERVEDSGSWMVVFRAKGK